MLKIRLAALLLLSIGLLSCLTEKPEVVTPGPASAPEESRGLSIYNVATSAASFNPSNGDKLEVRYSLARDASVTVQVFDADRQLVQTLASDSPRKAGTNKEVWDG